MYGFWVFFNGAKKWKSCSDKFRVYAGYISTSHHTASGLSCTSVSDTQVALALSSSSVSSPVSLSWPFFLMLASSFWTICQWWFGPTVSLCDCREADVPWCPSGTAWMDSPPGMPSLRSAAVPSVTVLFYKKCLPVYLLSETCRCVIYPPTAVPSMGFSWMCQDKEIRLPERWHVLLGCITNTSTRKTVVSYKHSIGNQHLSKCYQLSIFLHCHKNQKRQQHKWALFVNATGMIKLFYKSNEYQPTSVKNTVFSEDNNVTLATVKTTNLNFTKDLKEISCSRSFWKIQKIVCDIKIRCVYPIPPHTAILPWGWSLSRTGRKMRRGLSTTDTMMRTGTVRC